MGAQNPSCPSLWLGGMATSSDTAKATQVEREIVVNNIGHGGIEELSQQIDDAALSWALLRHETAEGTSGQELMVAIACHGADMPGEDHKDVSDFSAQVLQ